LDGGNCGVGLARIRGRSPVAKRVRRKECIVLCLGGGVWWVL